MIGNFLDSKGSDKILSFVGIIGTIVTLLLPVDDINIPLKWALAAIIVIITILGIKLNHYRILLNENQFKFEIPDLICGTDPQKSYSHALIILKYSKNFKHGGLTSFYYKDEQNITKLIGMGIVTFIQDDDENSNKWTIQVELTHFHDKYAEIVTNLRYNNKYTLERTTIHPNIIKTDLDELYFHLDGR